MSRALLGKCVDLFILLNELLYDTLHIYIPMAKKSGRKKRVGVAFATSEKEIEMKITASQTTVARNIMVFLLLIKPLDKKTPCVERKEKRRVHFQETPKGHC